MTSDDLDLTSTELKIGAPVAFVLGMRVQANFRFSAPGIALVRVACTRCYTYI